MATGGTGLTIAIGRSTAIFDAQHPLEVGSQVELFIDWPAKLMGRTPLQMYVKGAVCGLEGRSTVVAVKSFVFKIKPPSRVMPASAGAPSAASRSAAAV